MDYSLRDSMDSGVSKYLSLFLCFYCVSLATGLQCILDYGGNMEYTADSAKVDFTPDPGTDLTVDFTASLMGPSTGPEEFEAVVYAVKKDDGKYKCDYTKVLGYTAGADLTGPPLPGTPASILGGPPGLLGVSVDKSYAPTYTVEVSGIDENLQNIPFYEEDKYKANLYMCIELQQHACGRKQEFADVFLHIEIHLKSECETCPIAYIKREGPEYDDADVCAPELVCYLGEETPGVPGYGDKPIFYQGDEIQACIKYDEYSECDSDICFKKVAKFNATIYENEKKCGEKLCKDELSSDNLLALTGNPFTQVGPSTCKPLGDGVTGECHLSVE